MVLSGDTSGAVTLSVPAVAGTNTITVPAATGTMVTTATPQSGSIIQVVQGTYSTQTQITSTSYTNTGLSVSITPKFATSKILVTINQNLYVIRSTNAGISGNLQLLRAGSSVFDFGTVIEANAGTNGSGIIETWLNSSLMYLDSPATTSAITYSTQAKINTTANSASLYAQLASSPSLITLMEVAA
jgi:predicted nucleotidyltransferase